MFTWRHFSDIVVIAPRKDIGKSKPTIKALNERYCQKLTQLAMNLGFESKEILKLEVDDPDFKMAFDFVRQTQSMKFYHLFNVACTFQVQEICRILPTIREQRDSPSVQERPTADIEVPVEYRCGRPHEKSHEITKK